MFTICQTDCWLSVLMKQVLVIVIDWCIGGTALLIVNKQARYKGWWNREKGMGKKLLFWSGRGWIDSKCDRRDWSRVLIHNEENGGESNHRMTKIE